MALKIDGNVTIQNYVESGATLNITNIDHVDNFFASQEPKKKEVAAIEAIATEVAVVDGGLADYVRIPARQEEILTALHANIDGKKGRAVAWLSPAPSKKACSTARPFPCWKGNLATSVRGRIIVKPSTRALPKWRKEDTKSCLLP